MKFTLKLIILTTVLFGVLVFISAIIDNNSLSYPFWFYKDACSISVNPKTGEEFGVTSATDWLNLGLDIVVAFIIAFGFLFLLKRRKQSALLVKKL
ncbi:hypothetical protein EZJ43_08030 [Pedobacter changchengzhani]|uniref:Uncharacterized protein n=1 Tax=Pedobacter changchengzhani TaxID=2529274 RepID=A0A4R5ML33_9SPHI|nr:hypothetical protein [Pedobacter changchengzhani]TDG36457.1 hypothetical protein EZJ43_08030 [Pedobacter changchengzhani]